MQDWEISVASEKLAECQETILNLGKQLKALASPRDAALLDKVITNPVPAKINHRPSLLDQMLAEDDVKAEELKSPKTKEIICTGDLLQPNNPSDAGFLYGRDISSFRNDNNTAMTVFRASPADTSRRFNEPKHKAEAPVGSLAIVPKRQKGGISLWRKLLTRKKASSKKVPLAIGT